MARWLLGRMKITGKFARCRCGATGCLESVVGAEWLLGAWAAADPAVVLPAGATSAVAEREPRSVGRLLELTVTDLALIERLRLELAPGLNVFTGETGAWKSLLIDALGLDTGARADTMK